MLIKQKVCSCYLGKFSVSKVDLRGICGEWVGCNSVQCMKCQRWFHHRCSDVPRQVSLLSCWDVLVIIVQ